MLKLLLKVGINTVPHRFRSRFQHWLPIAPRHPRGLRARPAPRQRRPHRGPPTTVTTCLSAGNAYAAVGRLYGDETRSNNLQSFLVSLSCANNRVCSVGELELKSSRVVSEGDVMMATIRFLFRTGSTPTHISLARGKGINANSIKEKVKRVFREESMKSVKPRFVGSGPDILAISDDLYWKVECKGFGTGKPATHRNNIDRALASVVSYYGECPTVAAECVKNAREFLGLALPASEQYLRLLEARVRKPLRRRLNLWVLLYDHRKIRPVKPNDDYPSRS